MNKDKIDEILMVVVVFILGISLVAYVGLYNEQKLENEQLKEGLGDFMMYMVNVTIYAAELNNITTDELFEGFLEQEADRIVEEFKER